MQTKKDDLEAMLLKFQSDEDGDMTCVMSKLSKEWPHAQNAEPFNPKHTRPQIKFQVEDGDVLHVQERRKNRRGQFKKKCYPQNGEDTVWMEFEAIPEGQDEFKTYSKWCSPCADIELWQTTEVYDGENYLETNLKTDLECKVFYGADNKGKSAGNKCRTPQGLKCRSGSYTIFGNGSDEDRNLNRGGLRCFPSSQFTDTEWKSDCGQ